MSDNPTGAATLREVRASFDTSQQMQAAVDKLTLSGFDRADLTLPAEGHSPDETNSETTSKPASTGTDAQQARTLGSSTAGAVAAMAAAGLIIGTGGAAAPAVLGALVAGGAAGGATAAAIGDGTSAEQQVREAQAAEGSLVLSVTARTEAKVSEAEQILRAAGGQNIEKI